MIKNILLTFFLTFCFAATYAQSDLDALQKSNGLTEAYPNPASQSSRIEYNLENAGSIKIFDFIGKLHKVIPLNQGKGDVLIDVSNFYDGIYFINLESDGTLIQTKKLIVRH